MKKFGFKKIYWFFYSIFIFVLHLPFVFAKTSALSNPFRSDNNVEPVAFSGNNFSVPDSNGILKYTIYDSMRLGSMGLGRQVFDYALKGFNFMKQTGRLANENIISIVDFSKPSSEKRLFIIDLKNYKVLFNTYVAHGIQSGKEFASHFSNAPQSNKSSLGFYETMDTYIGSNGYSLRLQGIERGINDNANRRDIVIHGADYVDEKLVRSQGYIGRSWGCPALPQRLTKSIINKIKNGTCLFIFSPQKNYLAGSKILNSAYNSLGYAVN